MAIQRDIIKFTLEDGTPLHVEVSDVGEDFRRTSKSKEIIEAKKSFEETISSMTPVAQALKNSLKELNNPSEIALEFGLKFNAKAGVVFASAESEVAFKVALKWKND
jgi:hypothetical protein